MATETSRTRHYATVARSRVSRLGSAVQEHPLTWLLPAAIFLCVFLLYPLVEAFRMSFTNMSLIEPDYSYVGLDTFSRVFNSSDFWSMTRITVIFVGVSVVLQIGLGMILALAIDYGVRRGLYGSIVTRISVLSAWVIPGIVIGILWKIMLIETRYGVINYIIVRLGGDVVSFLSDGQMALLSTIMANTWRGTAFSMIMLYAGLQQVPEYLQDAARIDGASPLQRFRHITIPLLMPVLFINLVLITIYTVNTFDMVLALTGGGPGRATEVLALFMYFEAFNRFNLGTAAAIAVVMLLVNVVMTVIYIKYLLGEEEF
ncbi:carbohydrate ABC transporter permease [Saliphagus infecundisoli]|uniref:Carbohydrate ABC transporter permease n=1 Tax=Saliphagus infecundisoli TaxID=1849069 RepID=A0ABD5QK50_9EURY|nr:sugar ABC transporter permease [Saliphagus infecundisoli]